MDDLKMTATEYGAIWDDGENELVLSIVTAQGGSTTFGLMLTKVDDGVYVSSAVTRTRDPEEVLVTGVSDALDRLGGSSFVPAVSAWLHLWCEGWR